MIPAKKMVNILKNGGKRRSIGWFTKTVLRRTGTISTTQPMSPSCGWSKYPCLPVRGAGASSREPSSTWERFYHRVAWRRWSARSRSPTSAGIPSLISIVEASARAFLPPSSRLRSCTSFSAASFPCWVSSATLLAAVARSIASQSLIIACGALGAHANNSSTALLVVCANLQACTAFTHSLPCLCSIRLRSSCKQASSVVRLCVRITGASCAFPQLPCRWPMEHFKVARKPVGFRQPGLPQVSCDNQLTTDSASIAHTSASIWAHLRVLNIMPTQEACTRRGGLITIVY